MAFAENVKRLRIDKGYSQGELAKLADISQPMICGYETGKKKQPRGQAALRLAAALNVTCEQLFSDNPEVK